jgi:trehalose synthase-fused probable maltokinase
VSKLFPFNEVRLETSATVASSLTARIEEAPMIIEMKDKRVSNVTSDGIFRLPLERDVLPRYLRACRWYASKDDAAPSVTVEKSLTISDLPDAKVLILGVKTNEAAKRYLFPIRAIWECERPQTGVVCELRAGPAAGWLIDAFSDDQFVRVLLEGIRRTKCSSATVASLVFCRSQAFDPGCSFAQSDIKRSGAEQSNTSVTAGEAILKAFRQIEPGVHPELEMGRYLTETAGFGHVPKLLGSIEFVCPSTGSRTALCVLQSLIRDGKDGWEYVTAHLKKMRAEDRAGQGSAHELMSLAGKLGKRTAELHQAFGAATSNPAFEPEPASEDWLLQWKGSLLSSVSSVLGNVADRMNNFAGADSVIAKSLVARNGELTARVRARLPRSTKAKLTRLHGDFHLGQSLVTQGDVFIVDFEGEPMRPLAERRSKHLPLRDVAGMLRSLEYASATAAQDAELTEEETSTVQELSCRMQSSFLLAYSQAIAGCVSFPQDLTQADDLLELCLIEKALYEVQYEMANRPDWIKMPMAGLLAVMDGRRHSFTYLP